MKILHSHGKDNGTDDSDDSSKNAAVVLVITKFLRSFRLLKYCAGSLASP